MAAHKSDIQVSLDSTSIAVLKALLYQVEQAKAKREQQRKSKDNTADLTGQLPLLANIQSQEGDCA